MNQTGTLYAAVVTLGLLLAGCGGGDKSAAEAKPKADAKSEAKADPKAEAKGEGKAGEHAEKEGLKLSPEETKRAGIALEDVKAQAAGDAVTLTATIRPNQDRVARVAPRVEGRVVRVSASLGDSVRAGQALATLDSVAIGEAWTTLQQARSADRVAEADFKRASGLIAEEIIPQREFLRLKSEHERSESAVRAAEDRLRLLGVSPKGAGATVSTFALTAPLSGTIVQKKAIVGELGNPNEPLFTVADLSVVWVEANLTEAQVAKVRVGMPASVSLSAYPNERYDGRVTYVASLLDKDTRTIPVRIELPNKDGRLKPEMFATAVIETGGSAGTKAPDANTISVPDSALVLMQGQPTVFVFEHGGYEQRAVETGEKLSGRTIVKSGLTEGEQVVTAGTYALKARLLKSQISDEH